MRIASVGRCVFAAVFIALGSQGLITGQLTAVWWPIPEDVPGRQPLAYLCALVSLASGAGLLWKRTAILAARTLLAWLLLWCVAFRLGDVFHAPAELLPWYSLAESVVMIAAAWVLFAHLATDWDLRHVAVVTGDRSIRIARVLYGLCMIPFGLGHFIYFDRTVSMVPQWAHAPKAWAVFTGAAFLAAGAAIVLGVLARLAARLSVWQIGLFNLLVWIPMMAGGAGAQDASLWNEFAASVAIMAGGWVVADSYRIATADPRSNRERIAWLR